MAYADRNTSGSRIVAIVLVAVIIAGVGYAFVTGLAYQYIKKKVEELNTFDVNEPPPPPEEPPPPPPDTPVPPPPTQVVIPPSIVQVPAPPPTFQFTPNPPPAPPISPPAPPAPPAPPPPPPRKAKEATPRGTPQSWVTNDDYPPAARRAEQQGVTGFRLDVDAAGKVSNCTITKSSGFAALDNAVCSLMRRRARFSPAEDVNGNKVPDSWSNRFRWELPKD
ncbi:MAG: energy transducer TonB [Sphingomonas sp.]